MGAAMSVEPQTLRQGAGASLVFWGIILMAAGALGGQGAMAAFWLLGWDKAAGVAAISTGIAVLFGGAICGIGWLWLRRPAAGKAGAP